MYGSMKLDIVSMSPLSTRVHAVTATTRIKAVKRKYSIAPGLTPAEGFFLVDDIEVRQLQADENGGYRE